MDRLISVVACKEKAQFLLKFAGLQRIADKSVEVTCSLLSFRYIYIFYYIITQVIHGF